MTFKCQKYIRTFLIFKNAKKNTWNCKSLFQKIFIVCKRFTVGLKTKNLSRTTRFCLWWFYKGVLGFYKMTTCSRWPLEWSQEWSSYTGMTVFLLIFVVLIKSKFVVCLRKVWQYITFVGANGSDYLELYLCSCLSVKVAPCACVLKTDLALTVSGQIDFSGQVFINRPLQAKRSQGYKPCYYSHEKWRSIKIYLFSTNESVYIYGKLINFCM